MVVDKRGCLHQLKEASLELGCGPHKRHPEAFGVDVMDYAGVDFVGDVFDVLDQIPDSSVRAVYSYHFFEHVDDIGRLMDLLSRVMRPGGCLHVVVPHFSNPYYYSDYTHQSCFGLYSFSYLARDQIHRRKVPTYNRKISFELLTANLVFKSTPPFYVRHSLKKLQQFAFNLNRFTRELYEENLCYLFPCYEIEFLLKRLNTK